jgi:hypothetical protein
MTTIHKPFSLVYDLERTRPGEQVHAGPDLVGDAFARRLRDVERAGRLRQRLVGAETGAFEAARFCTFRLHNDELADEHLAAAIFYRRLYEKVCRLQARARGEASDGR